MSQRCISSLLDTADPELYTLIIVDNGSTDGTPKYLRSLDHPNIEDIIFNPQNIGTANAINQVWKIGHQREQYVAKIDNDVVWLDGRGWLQTMVNVLDQTEDIGLVGLKRSDLEEKANIVHDWFRSRYFTLPNGQVVEVVHHVMGTCWLVSHAGLNALGALKQVGPYGLDDSIYCHRLRLADLSCVFVPDIAIDHIDPGHPKYPDYTQWKIDRATEVMQSGDYNKLLEEYASGSRPLYEPFS